MTLSETGRLLNGAVLVCGGQVVSCRPLHAITAQWMRVARFFVSKYERKAYMSASVRPGCVPV